MAHEQDPISTGKLPDEVFGIGAEDATRYIAPSRRDTASGTEQFVRDG
jgi:hypothetical protein